MNQKGSMKKERRVSKRDQSKDKTSILLQATDVSSLPRQWVMAIATFIYYLFIIIIIIFCGFLLSFRVIQ